MFGLGPTELILIVLVLVLLFGAKKIPELMKGLGSGIKEFKKAASTEEDNKTNEIKKETNTEQS
jgi:sec-independent protein translocase protein TatA